MNSNALLDALMARQRELALSDGEFADYLRIPHSTWRMTRLGHRPVRHRAALAAMKAFPDLTPIVVALLLSDYEGDSATEARQPRQDGQGSPSGADRVLLPVRGFRE